MAIFDITQDCFDSCPKHVDAIFRLCTTCIYVGVIAHETAYDGKIIRYKLEGEELPPGDQQVSFSVDQFPGIEPVVTEIHLH